MEKLQKKLILSRIGNNSPESSGLDEDEILDKYSCSPPSPRTLTKLRKRRKQNEILSTYSSLDEFKLTCNTAKTKLSNLKQPHRQRSIQTISTNKHAHQKLWSCGRMSSFSSSFDVASSDEEEILADRCTPKDFKVESRNRFMSLTSRLVKLPLHMRVRKIEQSKISDQNRNQLQNYFVETVKLQNLENTNEDEPIPKSEEELVWQNEFKDLLWLELQAWVSQRSPQEQDQYLLTKRSEIPQILDKIMEYRFIPCQATETSCKGCRNAFCQDCARNQSKGLHEICSLLEELEEVEALYPSGRLLSVDYPLYGSEEFNNQIKTMCLWYNVSCLLQLKIDIIGHMLVSLGCKGPWPTWPVWPLTDDDVVEGDTALPAKEKPVSVNEENVAVSLSTPKPKVLKKTPSRVQFFVEKNLTCEHSQLKYRQEDSPADSWKSEYSDTDLPEADAGLKHIYVTEPSIESPLHQPNNFNQLEKSQQQPEQQQNAEATAAAAVTSTKNWTPKIRCLLYRTYIEKALRTKGLRKMLRWIFIVHRMNMLRAKEALMQPNGEIHQRNPYASSTHKWVKDFEPFEEFPIEAAELKDLHRYGTWSPEYQSLNLPQFQTLYVFLCRIPLDVIREALYIRLEQKPVEPSAMSIRQLMQEFKEGLRAGVICKQKYRRDVHVICKENPEVPHQIPDKDYDETLRLTLEVYLDYLKQWACLRSPTSAIRKNVMEQEWSFILSVCSDIPSGEWLAGKAFCHIGSSMLSFTGQFLRNGIFQPLEKNNSSPASSESENGDRTAKEVALSILRRMQHTLQDTRLLCLKAVGVTKMLCKDLAVGAEFDIQIPVAVLVQRLQDCSYIRVIIPNMPSFAVFVPSFLRGRGDYLLYMLSLTSRLQWNSTEGFLRDRPLSSTETLQYQDDNDGYVILLEFLSQNKALVEELWSGETMLISDLKEPISFDWNFETDVLLLITFNALHLASKRYELLKELGPGLHLKYDNRSSNFLVPESLIQLKKDATGLSQTILDAIQEVEDRSDMFQLDVAEHAPLVSRWKEVVRQCFQLAFEYHKDVLRLVRGKPNRDLAFGIIKLSHKWMAFAVQHCERGRGLKPKWAAQGLDFLATACDPKVTSYLIEDEFQRLKESMEECVGHVIGSAEPTASSSCSTPTSNPRKLSFRISVGSRYSVSNDALAQKERMQQSIEVIENARDLRLSELNLIGRVARRTKENRCFIRLKSVQFSWQRGVKIGQGSFGKVYVAVNNKTGEVMAMKEIALQPNDHKAIRSVTDELRIFEGIQHEHLVRYYGVEVLRDEMIIFMEYCPEGTLEHLVSSTESGLPEELIRRFTRQLLEAVAFLHQHGIIHRDIKGANIFLSNGGNCLKLGDFGCAAQIKSHTTMAGEIQGIVGTQAFMAPEVFMRTMAEGHGRAADIWSVGCVIIEMSTGIRPWADLESNYSIMFKVGMGAVPPTPETLSKEGQQFLGLLLRHDPQLRATAPELLQHPFLKIFQEEDVPFRA